MNRAPVEVPMLRGVVALLGDVWTRWFLSLSKPMEQLTSPQTFADNAAAVAGGLKTGDFYVTATGAVMRVL